MKILISLISDQSIPNILFIKQMQDIDFHILVTTAKMENERKTDRVIKVGGLFPNRFKKVVVVEDSLTDIKAQLEALKLQASDKYILNLTGGTKVMSIGVYRFFEEFDHETYYIPIGKNAYKRIYPKDDDNEYVLNYSINLEEYLNCYGIEVTNPININRLCQSETFTQTFFTTNWAMNSNIRNLKNYVDDEKRYNNRDVTQIVWTYLPNSLTGLDTFLNSIGFTCKTPHYLDKEEIFYLLGGWFEEYTYSLIKTKLSLNNYQIGKGVEIGRQNVKNECDVIFTYKNALYVIECKSAITKQLFDQTVYKLAAIKKEFGLFAKSYLFAGNSNRDRTGNIPQSAADRLRLMDIKMIDKPILTNVTEINNFFQRL